LQNRFDYRSSIAGERMAGAKEDRHFVTALARGLDVLACFRSADRMLGNHEIAQRCGLPKSTVSRLTYTLTRLGYLIHLPENGKYRPGIASLALGSALLSRLDVRRLARDAMCDLAESVGATVSLGARDRLSMIYVEHCRGHGALTLSLDTGSRIPMATTAMGRAYLARAGESERLEICDRLRDLDEFAWPRLREAIDRSIADHARLGCACSFGDWQPEVNAIAVALRPGGGLPPMVINCGGPAFSLGRERLLDEVRPRLIAMVARIEASLVH
jgi:DNA-binding IclR family transcriptional regulator